MRYRHLILLLITLLLACKKEQEQEVLVLPTIHGAHEMNPHYSYDDLMQLVRTYDPDVIGVEIRPEDFHLPSDSLDLFYPLEMIMVRDSFPGKVYGIDYYSEGTKDLVVSREMFQDTTSELYHLKRLSQDMTLDSVLVSRFEEAGIPEIHEEQRRMAQNYSAEEFLNGKYDSITGIQYRLEDSLFKNSKYEVYAIFNNMRDLQITKNALKLVEEHPQKRVLILVGANHRNRLVDSLENQKIKLVNDLNFKARNPAGAR